MPDKVEAALRMPIEVEKVVDGNYFWTCEKVAPLDEQGRFTLGPFLGLNVDQAHDLEDDYLEDAAKHGEPVASEEAYYALSANRSMLDMFLMHAYARTKNYGPLKLQPTFAQRDLIETIQRCYAEDQPCEILDLKARQVGGSTGIVNLYADLAAKMEGIGVLILCHREDKSLGLHSMIAEKMEMMPFKPRIRTNRKTNRDQFVKSGSIITVESAESKTPAHSSSFKLVLLSEYSRYPDAANVDKGVGATLPDQGFYANVIETTANGVANPFFRLWKSVERGEADLIPKFYSWMSHHRYKRVVSSEEEAEKIISRAEKVFGDKFFILKNELNVTVQQLSWLLHTLDTKLKGDLEALAEQFPAWPMEAFLSSGRPVFDVRALERAIAACKDLDPVFRGDIVGTELILPH